ncbi:hypothetical protein JGU71_12275 [Antrihabitans sp. YC3-6]|uniref:Uncharacterized protein n=1 Tax=Antrihabitans stalagmiti TaxID=2799499 RepID=A0A934NQV3_9NOCA|nr:hypothetical protein [Antrihabitans stalagmiti]MBJ8339664.1 hypothetical protein [Antrihabitans stalagmiti]
MKIHSILRRHEVQSIPLLESARMQGSPKKWPSEKLERLLTARELDQVLHHRV